MAYRLTTETTCDLPYSYYEERDIGYVGLGFVIDEKEYIEGPDQGIPLSKVYGLMRAKGRCTTNQANAYRFEAIFEPILKAGEDVLHISFSSGLSGTYQSAVQAANTLAETYPDRKIVVVDSLCASLGQGLLVHYAANNRDSGMSLEENAKWVEEHKLNIAHWFTVDDLMFLHRGGRVAKTTAVVGSVLGIKPIMHVDNDGHLTKKATIRGRNASLEELAKKMKESMIEDPSTATVFIVHGDCEEEAKKTAEYVNKHTGAKVMITNCLGCVIGSHAGPGTMAVFYLANER